MMKRTVALTILAITAAAGTYLGRGLLTARATPEEAPTFARPEVRTIAATVTTTGIVRLRVGAEVRVGSQVSGIVKKLNVTVGSRIRHDDVIAEIDAQGMLARLAQARAQVAVAEQEVRRADVELGRAQRLGSQGLVPQQQVEDATLVAQSSRVQLEKNRKDADVVETDLSYAVIRAPISGTIASVSTQEGETVAAAFSAPTFVTIIADHALQLIAMVDETDIANVAPGNPSTFTVEAYPTRNFEGRVERVAPKATIVSGVVNYEVMVTVTSATNALKPDMTANISIKTAERQALVVPSAAVQRDGEQRFVYVDEAGHLAKRVVSVGVREAGITEIRKGLTTAERVLTSSAPKASVKS
jgi:RND family efflux transporter MFP subunit